MPNRGLCCLQNGGHEDGDGTNCNWNVHLINCSLDGPGLSSCFQILLSLYQSFGDCIKNTNYNLYNRHFHVPQLFQFPSKVQVLTLLFLFFQFYSVVSWDSKVHNSASSFFSCWLLQGLVVWSRLIDPFVRQNLRGVSASNFPGQDLDCAYTICSNG